MYKRDFLSIEIVALRQEYPQTCASLGGIPAWDLETAS